MRLCSTSIILANNVKGAGIPGEIGLEVLAMSSVGMRAASAKIVTDIFTRRYIHEGQGIAFCPALVLSVCLSVFVTRL